MAIVAERLEANGMSAAIEIEDLTKRFGKTQALSGISVTAQRGRILGLLGPNGSGKTTTVRILATLLRPDGGRATVCGFDVTEQPSRVRELIGLTGQYAAVDEDLSGSRNIELIARLLGCSPRTARSRAADLLDMFGLTDAAGRLAKTYSGGMRRRLDLAVSLVGRPEVLYLDEPTTGLDPRSRNAVYDVVRGLVREGSTVLLTTQYLEEADRLADDLVVLNRGKVIAAGTPNQLKHQVAGRTLDVRPISPGDCPRVVGLLAPFVDEEPTVDEEAGVVSVAARETAILTKVSAALDEAGVPLAEIGLRQAHLDQVFLALTDSDDASHQARQKVGA